MKKGTEEWLTLVVKHPLAVRLRAVLLAAVLLLGALLLDALLLVVAAEVVVPAVR